MQPVLFHIGPIFIPAYGAVSALGVLVGLFLAQRTARIAGVNPARMWSLCVVALFTALIAQRLLLLILNWSALRSHPRWMLALSMIHHPLLTLAGAGAGVASSAVYALRHRMPLLATADALAAPLALGLACEQLGALLAGAGYGTETTVRWAVTYTNPLVARWSGTPLGVPLHPAQGYAALAFLTLSILLLIWLPVRHRAGDVAGLWLLGTGTVIYITELWRDREGRGSLFNGILDGPQLAAVLLVLAGALVLIDRKSAVKRNPAMESRPPARNKEAAHG